MKNLRNFLKGKTMTKTPEELTEDWKKGKLEVGKDYYIKTVYNEVLIDCYEQQYDESHYPQGMGFDNFSKNMIKRILAPVPTYDEYKAMQKCIANQRAELESARWYHTVQNEDIGELRGLMKECKANYERYISFCKENGCTKGLQEFENFLTRINTALSESEE